MSEQDWVYAGAEPSVSASFKSTPADFQVKEELGFQATGEGEHLFLLIEKSGLTTQEVHEQLVRFFQRPAVDVSYSGMKDKQALTQQWFSVRLADTQQHKPQALNSEQMQVLDIQKNNRKLKRGSHRYNHFLIRLCELSEQPQVLIERLERIKVEGVPNYFGEQRFGREYNNIDKARQYFAGKIKVKSRYQRGLYFSAARSWLFNQVLSRRIELGNWQSYLAGDVMQLDGSDASFKSGSNDAELPKRLETKDIHPTGPLWGQGEHQAQDKCRELEEAVVAESPDLKSGLEAAGLSMLRRALRSPVKNLQYRVVDEHSLELEFTLNKGSYATAVLRELVKLRPLNTDTLITKDKLESGAIEYD